MQSNKWYAVVNPASAHGRTKAQWSTFHQLLKAEGWEVDYGFTTSPGDGTRLTRQALESGCRRIIAVGGDGTLNEVVNGFFAQDTPVAPDAELAILAHGTGSDFIRSLNLTPGIDNFIKVLGRKRVLSIDVGKASFAGPAGQTSCRYFINVGDIGLGGSTVARVNARSKSMGGRISFLWGSIISMLTYRNAMMTCKIDGHLVAEGMINSIMVANGSYIGGGMMIAPQAQLDDGLFDIIILGNFSTFELLRHLPKIYKGTHIYVDKVCHYRGRHVEVETARGLMDLDGEQPGQAPAAFQIISKAIRLWT